MDENEKIAENLAKLNHRIALYEKQYDRPPGSVILLAASKGQSIDRIKAAVSSGQYVFGENYWQEAKIKMAALIDEPIEWHFIGHIQKNKTQKIAEHFSWVQSVASQTIAERLNAQRPQNLPPLNICLEVNVSGEQEKSGVSPQSLHSLAEYCQTLPRLRLRGLMAIPAPMSDFKQQRQQFHKIYTLWHDLLQHGFMLDTLSMGMSEDFEAAIAEGSTCIRLGTALFGNR